MKKLFLLLAAILSLQCAMAQNVDVFVKGGIGMSNYVGDDTESTDVKCAYKFGVGLDVPLKNIWKFETGLYLNGWGAKEKASAYGVSVTATAKPLYLELPIMAKAAFPLSDKFNMSIAAGPYLALGVGGKLTASAEYQGVSGDDSIDLFGDVEDNNAGMKRFDMGLGVNFNFEVKRIIFGLDTRFGLTKVYEDTKAHNISALFVVGYRF